MHGTTTRPPGPALRVLRTLVLGALAGFAVAAAPPGLAAQDRGAPPLPAVRPSPSTGWVGINVRVTERTGEPALVTITDVWPGSPAEKAGIRPGDRVLEVNGVEISPRQFRSLSQRLGPGDPMMLVVERDGGPVELTVVAEARSGGIAVAPERLRSELEVVRGRMARILAGDDTARPDSRPAPLSVRVESAIPRIVVEMAEGDSIRTRVIRLDSLATVRSSLVGIRGLEDQEFVFFTPDRTPAAGAPPASGAPPTPVDPAPGRLPSPFIVGLNRVAGAELRPMNPGLARYFETGTGLLVTAVADGTPAAAAGLRPGDVLVEANGETVGTVAALRGALTARADSTTLTVVRRGARISLRIR